ncbi:ROK family transcriptional regulator [Tsukamurella sp. 8F]|uniref:ROK family transcriptional regulator n=1 Tax=unclassified Tsukamurella TaxID=2633480 RepID=UPI0023BA1BE8|nr:MULTISPECIES: ROK family transcriptional regulator [unclassified Tsukamurella]MDF0529744.1 ROK family transcriptional regulator [Tsukamurella sp. 8J]MDF0586029.1 ROK family transcriptional regulator [Tsukamurella sp. 8F]
MSETMEGPSAAGLVLRAVLDLGSAPRSAIATRARLSPATVTGQTRRLTAAGLLREQAQTTAAPRVGRPHVPLTLDTDNTVAAVHFAATTTRVAIVDIAGAVRDVEALPHGTPSGTDLARAAAEALAGIRERTPEPLRPFALGVATGGRVDPRAGLVHDHPYLDWRGVPVRDLLEQLTGLPTTLDSHSRAIVHAEQLFGALDYASSAAVLFVGNVLDAAFAVGGRVHYGPGATAGALGSVVASAVPGGFGRLGELSDHAVLRRAVAHGLVSDDATLPGLLQRAAVDGRIRALFVERARDMAYVAAALIDLLNPEKLIITDRAFHHLPDVREAYRAGAAARSAVPDAAARLVGTSFPGRALETASAATVLWPLYDDPFRAESAALKRMA